MPLDTYLVPLRSLLRSADLSKESVKRALKSFECDKDCDVRCFLSQWAITNERNGASRTYLVLNRDMLESGKLDIVAFFAIAITATDYSAVDASRRREILGNVPSVGKSALFPGYLLAQLARDDRYSHDDFDCALLIAQAEEMMLSAWGIVGGNVVYLDCKDVLVSHYERFGFRRLYYDKETSLNKMMKRLS